MVPGAGFEVCCRLVKSGGYAVISCGEWNLNDYGFKEALDKVDALG